MLGDNSRCIDVDRDSEPVPVFPTRDMQPHPPTSLFSTAMIRNNTPDNQFKTNTTNPGINQTNKGGLTSSSRVQRLMSSPAHSERLSENTRHPPQSNQAHSHHHHHSNSQSNSIGHYELKKTLGKGNFSTVKLAQHKMTRHSVAIKIAKFSALSEENLMKLHREIDVLKKLGRHNHIVRLYQVIKTKRYFFLVTEYCANGELYEYLVAKGRLDEAQSCKYFRQILSAVEYLHDHNIVHRDLKAENLLLTDNCETVKIADFGFANYFKLDNPLSTWCGSPPYAAPELFNGLLYKGPPVDIWSMGVILYVLVCGSLPFDGPNLVHLKSRVTSGKFRIPFFMTDDCESLIRGMLRLDPERRYSIKQIKAHAWTQKYSKAQQKDSLRKKQGASNEREINNNRSPTSQMSDNRGQSLDSDEDKMIQASDLQQNADGSMSCLTNQSDNPNKMHKPNFDTDSKISPSNIRNFVDTEIVNAVSNMSIDSNNSSISQGMDITNATTFSNHSGCVSSLSSSRYSGTPRADSACQTNQLRQFSKESSIDDQIIDFMVDNLKIADNHTSIRQSIANDKYDDLHAIYRLLKDQPEMVLEAKFKIPSLPLILPNKDEGGKKPSITTGFFNFTQVNNSAASTRVEATRASFSGETIRREPNCQVVIEDHNRPDIINPISIDQRSENYAQELASQEQGWKIPPQLFLTPPIEGRTQVTRVEDESEAQDSASIMRSNVARHSFDSAIRNKPAESSPSHGLTRDSLWDSSMLDSQGASLTPTTPVKLGDSFVSTGFAEGDGAGDEAARLVQNLATITTNLPQIGSYLNSPSVINHNLLLAQLNSGCNALMTQSGLLAQHDVTEQRLQQNIPLKFTPNNLVNQNYHVINNLALQNTLKLPGVPNLSLLDPDNLMSGLERRASDGQASYSSLTTANQTSRGKQGNSDADQRPHEVTDSSSANQILKLAMSGHTSPLATNTYQKNPSNLDSLFGKTQFSAQDSGESSKSINDRNGDGCQVGNLVDVNGPLDLSNKLPSTGLRSCDIESGTRDGLKRFSTQRSNSTASETAVCFQNLPNSATTSPRISTQVVTTSNNGIPFCHASKRAKKLH